MYLTHLRELILMVLVTVSLIFVPELKTQTIYLDAGLGDDGNPGTKEKPLQSFERVAEITNVIDHPAPLTIMVAPGVYNLKETILFNNDVGYTDTERFTIRAELLPDDKGWKPKYMPVIISTAIPDSLGKTDNIIEMTGLKVEINHVTIQGLKFLGNPVPEIWYYPIFREGKELDDLLVKQCVFAMESYAVTCNVGVLANGHGLVVDHCIFYNCRNPVVFWRAENGDSHRNAMRYCIIDGAYTSACWVCDTGDDFEFHHNIITRSNFVWMRSGDNNKTYTLHDCIITGNKIYSGINAGPGFNLVPAGEEIKFDEKYIARDGNIQLELGNGIDHQIPRDFLNIKKGTFGYELHAGLFIK